MKSKTKKLFLTLFAFASLSLAACGGGSSSSSGTSEGSSDTSESSSGDGSSSSSSSSEDPVTVIPDIYVKVNNDEAKLDYDDFSGVYAIEEVELVTTDVISVYTKDDEDKPVSLLEKIVFADTDSEALMNAECNGVNEDGTYCFFLAYDEDEDKYALTVIKEAAAVTYTLNVGTTVYKFVETQKDPASEAPNQLHNYVSIQDVEITKNTAFVWKDGDTVIDQHIGLNPNCNAVATTEAEHTTFKFHNDADDGKVYFKTWDNEDPNQRDGQIHGYSFWIPGYQVTPDDYVQYSLFVGTQEYHMIATQKDPYAHQLGNFVTVEDVTITGDTEFSFKDNGVVVSEHIGADATSNSKTTTTDGVFKFNNDATAGKVYFHTWDSELDPDGNIDSYSFWVPGYVAPAVDHNYYLIGDFNTWATYDSNYQLTPLGEQKDGHDQYGIDGVTLTSGQEFKFFHEGSYYPDGDNITYPTSGNPGKYGPGVYNIYFVSDFAQISDWGNKFYYMDRVGDVPEEVHTVKAVLNGSEIELTKNDTPDTGKYQSYSKSGIASVTENQTLSFKIDGTAVQFNSNPEGSTDVQKNNINDKTVVNATTIHNNAANVTISLHINESTTPHTYSVWVSGYSSGSTPTKDEYSVTVTNAPASTAPVKVYAWLEGSDPLVSEVADATVEGNVVSFELTKDAGYDNFIIAELLEGKTTLGDNWMNVRRQTDNIGIAETSATLPVAGSGNYVYYTETSSYDGNLYLHSWQNGGSSTTTWPGTQMKYLGLNSMSQKVFRLELPVNHDRFIINNNKDWQTDTLGEADYFSTGHKIGFYYDSTVLKTYSSDFLDD